jgi:AraC-like DNA-binding protein
VPNGSSMFADADGYAAAMQDILDLLVLRPLDFRARVSWIEFSKLYMLRAHETCARVAFLSLPGNRVFITFPTQRGSALLAGGAVLPFGDILVHRQGDRFHQRTTGSCHWGYISLSPDSLNQVTRMVTGHHFAAPRRNRTLRPSPEDRRRLLRLHAQAGRLAETDVALVDNPEVVRALEQDLTLALVSCLSSGESHADRAILHHQAAMLVEFEALLAKQPYRKIPVSDICNKLGVSDARFRAACTGLLGMSPGRYQRLRQLKSLRGELTRADPRTNNGIEVVKRYGFADFHRFLAEYWQAYGELPPLPPRHIRTHDR